MSASEPLPGFDLYRELGVPSNADRATIETAYRRLMKLHHPDVATLPRDGLERGKRLNIARQWLTDPLRRSRYDRSLGLDRAPLRNEWQPAPLSAEELLHVRPRPRPRAARPGIPFGSILLVGVMLVLGSLTIVGTNSVVGFFSFLTIPVGLLMVVYGLVGVVVGLFVGSVDE